MISIILTSRLLMCSSVSVSLLFIPFNVFFFLISAIELLIFDWGFIFSGSYWRSSYFRSTSFPNSVNIFTSNTSNNLSGKLFIFLSLFIFSGVFSCFFQLGVAPLAFSFYLLFPASLNLGVTVTCILKGYSYVGVPCCRRHMLKAFDGRAGSDAGASHVFPQSVLLAITLVRIDSEDRVARGVRQSILSGQGPSPPY